jgi:hypothetical protein
VVVELPEEFGALTPVLQDGVVLGTVIIRHSLRPLHGRLAGLTRRTVFYGALLVAGLARGCRGGWADAS